MVQYSLLLLSCLPAVAAPFGSWVHPHLAVDLPVRVALLVPDAFPAPLLDAEELRSLLVGSLPAHHVAFTEPTPQVRLAQHSVKAERTLAPHWLNTPGRPSGPWHRVGSTHREGRAGDGTALAQPTRKAERETAPHWLNPR